MSLWGDWQMSQFDIGRDFGNNVTDHRDYPMLTRQAFPMNSPRFQPGG